MSQFPPQSPPPPPPPPPSGGYGGPPSAGGGQQPAEAGAAISYGWKKFQEHWQSIIVALIVGFVVIVAVAIIGGIIQASITDTDCKATFDNGNFSTSGCEGPGLFTRLLAGAVVQFLVFLGTSVLQLFVIRATLMIVRGQSLDASSIMKADNLGQYMLGAILVGIGSAVGLMLCIIPGLVFIFLSLFWGYFVVDKNMSAVEAIQASINLVKDNVGPVLIFLLLGWVVMIAGVIACGVGVIVAWPVVIIATGYMYKRLQGEPVAA